ncbi:hypothetical protein KC356_g189 [Hortaea werneckii]|nr:hypothetical protein KC356_g189 [Hortaea werneckii]
MHASSGRSIPESRSVQLGVLLSNNYQINLLKLAKTSQCVSPEPFSSSQLSYSPSQYWGSARRLATPAQTQTTSTRPDVSAAIIQIRSRYVPTPPSHASGLEQRLE